jgi:hypothetical protein
METKILVQIKNGRADFINVGAKCLIGSVPTFTRIKAGRKKTGYVIGGRVFTDVGKAIKKLIE